jgi:hypothetical protein
MSCISFFFFWGGGGLAPKLASVVGGLRDTARERFTHSNFLGSFLVCLLF